MGKVEAVNNKNYWELICIVLIIFRPILLNLALEDRTIHHLQISHFLKRMNGKPFTLFYRKAN